MSTFVDTSVLVHARDMSEPDRQAVTNPFRNTPG
jgi:hypothetical protein